MSWRDKRPVTVGNWAVPEHLWKISDLDEWDREDAENYFLKFVLTDGTLDDDGREKLRHKIKFLANGSEADFHRPLRDCCVDRRVNEAAADLACLRTKKLEASCIVKRAGDQNFYIPQLHIEEAMQRMAARSEHRTAIQQLQAVHDRRAKNEVGKARPGDHAAAGGARLDGAAVEESKEGPA